MARLSADSRGTRWGVVTGLAWTEVGGEILTIEALMMPGKGKMTVTGKSARRDEGVDLGCVVIRALGAATIGVKPPVFDKRDIHVRRAERSATPKDGPSAGVAIGEPPSSR